MLFFPLFSSLFLAKNFESVRATFLHWFGQGVLGLIGSMGSLRQSGLQVYSDIRVKVAESRVAPFKVETIL